MIKNAGGGIAPTGGYIAGRADLVELCSYRLSAPGTGRELGCTLSVLREMYMGAFHAPAVTAEAVKSAVFASARPYHHPMSRNDMIPTPSQPMNSWKRLFAVTRMSIVMRNRSRYLKNLLILGSEYIYHIENSIIDHVTNSATGINIIV